MGYTSGLLVLVKSSTGRHLIDTKEVNAVQLLFLLLFVKRSYLEHITKRANCDTSKHLSLNPPANHLQVCLSVAQDSPLPASRPQVNSKVICNKD